MVKVKWGHEKEFLVWQDWGIIRVRITALSLCHSPYLFLHRDTQRKGHTRTYPPAWANAIRTMTDSVHPTLLLCGTIYFLLLPCLSENILLLLHWLIHTHSSTTPYFRHSLFQPHYLSSHCPLKGSSSVLLGCPLVLLGCPMMTTSTTRHTVDVPQIHI